jgi:hypothetical protein
MFQQGPALRRVFQKPSAVEDVRPLLIRQKKVDTQYSTVTHRLYPMLVRVSGTIPSVPRFEMQETAFLPHLRFPNSLAFGAGDRTRPMDSRKFSRLKSTFR